MLGADARTFRVVWTIFLFALLMATLYAIRQTLILLAVAIFVAYMLAPLVDLVERVMPKRRGVALAIVYVALVGVLVTAGVTLGSQIVDEASSFFGHLPGLVKGGKLFSFPLPSWLEPLRARIIGFFQQEATSLQASAVPLLQSFSSHLLTGIGFIILIVLVPILSFFLLKDGPAINAFLVQTLEEAGDRTLIRQILDDIHVLLSKYIRALVLLALASFIGWAVFLSLTAAPYQLLLAGICGALEFIPGIGPAVALAIVFVVCSASGYSAGLLWIVIFWIAFRLFQDYVLNPVLMSAGVQLHPLLVLLGIVAGGHIGGIPGLFFSVPIIAILKVVFMRLREAQIRETLSHRRAL
jgi:predicted PurR-regulated permease PerM